MNQNKVNLLDLDMEQRKRLIKNKVTSQTIYLCDMYYHCRQINPDTGKPFMTKNEVLHSSVGRDIADRLFPFIEMIALDPGEENLKALQDALDDISSSIRQKDLDICTEK